MKKNDEYETYYKHQKGCKIKGIGPNKGILIDMIMYQMKRYKCGKAKVKEKKNATKFKIKEISNEGLKQ